MDRDLDTAAKPLHAPGRSFWRNEDGTILIFTTCMMIIMLMLSGMAIDIMRYETTRTELQQTLDRSTLASASLTQDLNPEDVVRDYFDKAGLEDKLTLVDVTSGVNFRTVRAEARANTNPIFLRLYNGLGTDQIEARGLSVAEQRITNVEISLVLDVSGSMGGRKIADLKTAAKEFVDTVLDADGENKISISLVPYNAKVNIPQNMQDFFTSRVDDHDEENVNCFDLPPAAYTTTGLSSDVTYPVSAYADTTSSANSANSYQDETDSGAQPVTYSCKPNDDILVMGPTNNKTRLKNHIDDLDAQGNTSIMAGMKWALALIDPGSRDLITHLVGQGETPAPFGGRPYAYDDDNAMKVIVLMTDGEHVADYSVREDYRSGNSGIWRSNGDGNYSRYQNRANTSNDYWVPHRSEWRSAPWDSGSGATQQTWPQMWERQRMTWVARQLFARANGNSSSSYNSAMNAFRSSDNATTMNAQLQSLCNMARDDEVIVYGIAFEAPTNGANQIRSCASTPGHFFNANGLEIQSAFRAIASNISQLRLTQ